MCLGEEAVVVSVAGTTAVVRTLVGDLERTASTALHPEIAPSDRVLLHTGFVVEVLDSAERAPITPRQHQPDGTPHLRRRGAAT